MKTRTRSSSGFTLIEMLVVIAIIALLAAILVPTINRALARAKSVHCISNLRQIGIAMTGYTTDNRSFLPPVRDGGGSGNTAQYPGHSPTGKHWMEFISGYLGTEVEHISEDGGIAAITRACPEWVNERGETKPGYGMNIRPAAGSSAYQGGPSPPLFSPRAVSLYDIDSPSNTILVGDSVDWHIWLTGAWLSGNWWTDNSSWGYVSAHPNRHGRHANYLMADSSVSGIPPEQALTRLQNPTQ